MKVRPRLALVGAWMLLFSGAFPFLPASASPVPAGTTSGRSALTIQASPWVLPSRPLAITLEQRGVLAGRRLAVYLFVDQNQFERITTKADRTQTSIELPPLAPGRYVLTARVGSEAAQTGFRVIPWSWPAGVALALLLAGSGLGLMLRRRRRASQGS